MWSVLGNITRGFLNDNNDNPYGGDGPSMGGSSVDMSSFLAYYQCHSAQIAAKPEIEKGNKILLPASALAHLARLDVEWPMLFKIMNTHSRRSTHCGVLEFSADEGKCYLPYWMMQNLLVNEGDFVCITTATLPKGNFVKLQPLTSNFLEISNHRAVLENSLRHFACLSIGDIIQIKYNEKIYEIEILELKPADAVSIIEVDVEVDFAPPKDYVEPKVPIHTSPLASVTDTMPSENENSMEEEPWLNRIPGGIRTENSRYRELVARGRIRPPTTTPVRRAGLFQGACQQTGSSSHP